MHPHLGFTTTQILWTLTFAAQLVLLVVLLGRERIARFPFFTAAIVISSLRLLVEVLLGGRMAQLPLKTILLALAAFNSIASLLVVIEVARRAFAGARRNTMLACGAALLLVAGLVTAFWGVWPRPQDLHLDTLLGALQTLQFGAEKLNLLDDLLNIQLGILVVLFGRRFTGGWRSHPQMIVIGLSTVSSCWLAVLATWQIIAKTVHPLTRADYEKVLDLGNKMMNANKVVVIAAIVWWIIWLWQDEPGAIHAATASDAAPVETEPAQLPAETAEIGQ